MASRAGVLSPPARRRLLRGLFVVQFPLLELGTRGASPWSLPRVVELVAALSLGWLCSCLARGGASRLAGACVAATYVVVQVRFYSYYHTTIDARVVESLVYSWGDVWPVVTPALPSTVAAIVALGLVEYAVLTGAAPSVNRPRRAALGVAVATVLLSIAVPALGITRRYLSRGSHAEGRIALPELPSTRAVLPNILVLLTESVRASDYCGAHGSDCRTSPAVDALLPDRLPLLGMRAVASYTTVSVAALFTGRPPLGSLATLSSTPGFFDFMKAARVDGAAPTVAYWSAQTDSVFWRSDVRRSVDSFVAVNDLVGHAVGDEDEVIDQGVDRLLASHVERHLPALTTPFALVLHFQGTHAPYFTDDARAPFLPMSHTVTWSGLDALHNAYRDAIFEQDRSIARSIAAFLHRVGKEPYVILFTSDHGEAFGEHGAIHHGQNLYDEQIHVPAWLAAGNGALDAAQLANVKSYRDALVTHFDVLPTLLDVAGLLDGYAMAKYRRPLLGRSLIAPPRALSAPVPVTNCTALFPCPLDTWGMLDETGELVAQPWDSDFRCAPLDAANAGAASDCERLRRASQAWFATKPNGTPNRAPSASASR